MAYLTTKNSDLSVFHRHRGIAMTEAAQAQSTPSPALVKYVFFAMVRDVALARL
jgi:hypothetical protein